MFWIYRRYTNITVEWISKTQYSLFVEKCIPLDGIPGPKSEPNTMLRWKKYTHRCGETTNSTISKEGPSSWKQSPGPLPRLTGSGEQLREPDRHDHSLREGKLEDKIISKSWLTKSHIRIVMIWGGDGRSNFLMARRTEVDRGLDKWCVRHVNPPPQE